MQRLFNATQLSEERHRISREPPEKWNSYPATQAHTHAGAWYGGGSGGAPPVSVRKELGELLG